MRLFIIAEKNLLIKASASDAFVLFARISRGPSFWNRLPILVLLFDFFAFSVFQLFKLQSIFFFLFSVVSRRPFLLILFDSSDQTAFDLIVLFRSFASSLSFLSCLPSPTSFLCKSLLVTVVITIKSCSKTGRAKERKRELHL